MKKYLLVSVSLSLGLAAALMCGCSILPEDSPQQETTSGTGQAEAVGEPVATAPPSNAESEDSNAEGTDQTFPFYGTWEVKDYQIQAETQYEISPEDMETFRGAAITYQSDSVVLEGRKVSPDDFTYETDDTAYDYDGLIEVYGANLGEWWNNVSEVTHITIASGNAFFGDQFFIVDSDTIWIYYKNVFFFVKRSENGGTGQEPAS